MNMNLIKKFTSRIYNCFRIASCPLLTACCSLLIFTSAAQEPTRHKIAIFAPLYLDSAFDESGNFKYEKSGAKFTNAGLDFYFG
ncbi:MAG: hypothetical protein ACJ749_13540, partial [Flavisolibacter sp.]